MSGNVLFGLTVLAALGSGLMSGAFFVFSAFIMPGLGRLAPPVGIAAMQSINIVAVTPPLMIALFGTALVCVLVIAATLIDRQAPGLGYRLAGCLLYLVGAVGVTMALNVPLNDALAAVDPESADGAAEWTRYLSEWTTWNNVRTVTSLAAGLAFTLAATADR